MSTVQVDLSAELLELAEMPGAVPAQAAKLIALELFREERVSLGKAAELAGMALADFMTLAAERAIPLHYAASDWRDDHQAARKLAQ
jgi:predicted HTH domain antitoxin